MALLGAADEGSLRTALQIFTDLGAAATARLTRQVMREPGHPVHPGRPARHHP